MIHELHHHLERITGLQRLGKIGGEPWLADDGEPGKVHSEINVSEIQIPCTCETAGDDPRASSAT